MEINFKTPYKRYLINHPDSSVEEVAKAFGKTRIEDIAAIKMVVTKFFSGNNKLNKKDKIRKSQKRNTKILKNLPFKNEFGHRKSMFRQRKVNLVKNSGILSGKYLHFPSQTCADAILFNKQISKNKFKFIGCERDKKVIPDLYKRLYTNKLFMDVCICDMRDKINEAKYEEYAHIDFDYCGTVSKYFPDVASAMKNKIVKIGGLIFVAFNMRDSKYSTTNKLKDLIKKHCGNNYELIDDEVLWYSSDSSNNVSSNKYMTASIRRIK